MCHCCFGLGREEREELPLQERHLQQQEHKHLQELHLQEAHHLKRLRQHPHEHVRAHLAGSCLHVRHPHVRAHLPETAVITSRHLPSRPSATPPHLTSRLSGGVGGDEAPQAPPAGCRAHLAGHCLCWVRPCAAVRRPCTRRPCDTAARPSARPCTRRPCTAPAQIDLSVGGGGVQKDLTADAGWSRSLTQPAGVGVGGRQPPIASTSPLLPLPNLSV